MAERDDMTDFEQHVQIAARIIKDSPDVFGKTPAEGAAKLYETVTNAIDRPFTEFLDALIKQSNKDEGAYDTLNLIAGRLLMSKEQLPDELSVWLGSVILDKLPRPISRGRKSETNYTRNRAIKLAVDTLVARGLQPTRHSPSGYNPCRAASGSACDAAGIAYERVTGDRLNYKTVEGVLIN